MEHQKIVAVPDSELRKLEQSRLKLYQIAEEYDIPTYLVMEVSGIMWELAHRKYPEVLLKIKDFVGNEEALLNKRVVSMKEEKNLGTITAVDMADRYPSCTINWDNGNVSNFFIENLNNQVL